MSAFVPLAASGGPAEVVLVDVQTMSGKKYYWSEHVATWPSMLGGSQQYLDWIVGAAQFKLYGTTQTDTASLQVQNLSGNTMERDVALAVAQNEFIGAFVYARLWHGAAQNALISFMGNITDVELDENAMTLSIESFKNFSAIKAPAFSIDVTCGLYFGSPQCGSTGALCQQSYGTCSSIERFQGVIIQWDNGQLQLPSQIAQPAPAAAFNPARAF
jgi:phage-related protein